MLREKMIKRSRFRKLAVSRDWNHPTTFITRQTYEKYRYKCESLHDDWDLVLRIRRAGLKIVVVNEVLANFRLNGTSHEKDLSKCIARGRPDIESIGIMDTAGYTGLSVWKLRRPNGCLDDGRIWMQTEDSAQMTEQNKTKRQKSGQTVTLPRIILQTLLLMTVSVVCGFGLCCWFICCRRQQ